MEDNNRFATSFSKIRRYSEFTQRIFKRYQTAADRFIANSNALRAATVPDEQQRLLSQGHILTVDLHLEIESFFLFAKILLDKIAHSLEFYFGPIRNASLDSHDCLVRTFTSFAKKRGLVLPSGWIDLAASLKKDISDFRDYEIAHEKSPRRVSGTVYSASGGARLTSIRIYSTPRDQQVTSEDLSQLMTELDEYIEKTIALITDNRDLTHLKRKPAPN